MSDIDVARVHSVETAEAVPSAVPRQERLIADLACRALGPESIDGLLKRAADTVMMVCEASQSYVFELEEGARQWRLRCSSGRPPGGFGAPDSLKSSGHSPGTTPVILAPRLEGRPRFDWNELPIAAAGHTGIIASVYREHGMFGVIGCCWARDTRESSGADRDALERIASILTAAVRRSEADDRRALELQRLRDLSDVVPQIVWSADENGTEDYFNERWNWLVDGRGDRRKRWYDVLHPEDRDAWSRAWTRSLREATPFEMECRVYIESLADYRWHLMRALPKLCPRSKVVRWYGSSTDIHDQKRIQRKLREQAHELEMVSWINATLAAEIDLDSLVRKVVDVGMQLSGAQFGAYVCNPDGASGGPRGYVVSAKPGTASAAFGLRAAPRLSSLFGTVFADRRVFRSLDLSADDRYDGLLAEVAIPAGPGRARSCLAMPVMSRCGNLLGGIVFGHEDPAVFDEDDERIICGLATQTAIAIDKAALYRELEKSKNEARHQYEQLNAIYETAPVGLCFMDRDLTVVSMNRHLQALIGCAAENLCGRTLTEALGKAAPALATMCAQAASEGRPQLNREVQWVRADDDTVVCWLCSCYPIAAASGTIAGVNTVVQDITERKQGDRELARLASIIENSYDAIIGKTLDGVITSWNSGAERIYGYSADEAVGRHISFMIPPDRLHEELDVLAALRAGNHVSLSETVRVARHGSRVQVSATLSPIRNGAGEIVGVSSIARDITAGKIAERKASENESLMRFILQATRIGTWDWDVQTNAVSWSDNMEELHGRSPGTFDGTLTGALADVHPEDKNVLESAIAAAMTGDGDYHIEYRIVTEDGRVRWLEAKGQILRDERGRAARMAGICMDVTDRREAENALRVSETMLRAQTDELAMAHRQKDQFLAMLAHELRNPLAPISNAVQLLKVQRPEEREKTLGWAVGVIDRQVWLLSRLVDDLLDIARITRGHIELKTQPVDLRDIARMAIETASVWFEMKEQTLEAEYDAVPVWVCADPARLIQAVSNMLNNAAKFTPEHGRAVLRVFRENDNAVLSVTDDGIGISAELLAQVFEPFTQADRSLDRREGGLGLGLSLVKRLVEMHGGSVQAFSAGLGRGSEFALRMPVHAVTSAECCPPAEQGTTQCRSEGTTGDRLRVLLVDDNRQATDAMALLLDALGHSVQVAYDGSDALRAADELLPDIVFLDIGLPLMDGYEVAQRLRGRFGNSVRLIALTGYAPKAAGYDAGVDDFDEYLLKPISMDTLASLLVRPA